MSEILQVVASHLAEEDVGISEYIGDCKGFFGIIKQRFSDFLVNEISTEGSELHLTDLKSRPKPSNLDDDKASKEVERPGEISPEAIAGIEALLASRGTENTPDPVMAPVSNVNKERRTAMHNFFNKAYKNLISSTVDKDGQKYIKVTLGSEQSLKYDKKRRTPQHLRQCLRFLLYKENMDTMEAVGKLASKLRIPAHKICYAGTKDRRAKTVQLMSVYDVAPERLVKAVKTIPRMMVGNMHYHPHPLSLGRLSGNHFTIVLREVKGDDADISAAVTALGSLGAINYYGMQRFGSRPGHTHVVGRYLLLGQWDKAVQTILMPDPGLFEKSKILREFSEKKISAAEAVKQLEECRGKGIEHTVLKGLAELGPSDMLGAINRLTRNIRNLYVHAYQSYLWNKVVSRRIKKHGLAVLPGDLISAAPHQLQDEIATGDEEENHEALAAVAANKKLVRRLEESEVPTTAISQVVVPGLGHAVIMPENELALWYQKMLSDDGLTMAAFGSTSKYGVCGCYRAIVVTPQRLAHHVRHYTDPLLPLVPSDVDLIHASTRDHTNASNDGHSVTNETSSKSSSDLLEDSIKSSVIDADPSSEVDGDSDVGENIKSNGAAKASGECKTESGDGACAHNAAGGHADAAMEADGLKNDESHAHAPEKETVGSNSEETSAQDGNTSTEDGVERQLKAVVLQFTLPSAAYATMVLRQLLRMPTSSQFHAGLGAATPLSGYKRPASQAQGAREEPLDRTSALRGSCASSLKDSSSPTKKIKLSHSEAS